MLAPVPAGPRRAQDRAAAGPPRDTIGARGEPASGLGAAVLPRSFAQLVQVAVNEPTSVPATKAEVPRALFRYAAPTGSRVSSLPE